MSLLMGPSMGSMALAPIGPVFVRLLGGRRLRLTAPRGLFGRAGQADAGGKTARPSSPDLLPARVREFWVCGIFGRNCDDRGLHHEDAAVGGAVAGHCSHPGHYEPNSGGRAVVEEGGGREVRRHPRRQARLSRFPARSAAFSILRCLTAAKVRNAVAESGVTRAAILMGVF
jgi:hypothetical protein